LELTVLMALFSLLLTLGVWRQSKESAVEKAEALFNLKVEELAQGLVLRIADYEQVLRGARGLFAASHAVEEHEWRSYVQELKNGPLYLGMESFAVLRAVDDADIEHFVKTRRRDPNAREFTPILDPGRQHHIILTYSEPAEVDSTANVGLDLTSDPIRALALFQACDSGQPAVSAPMVFSRPAGGQVRAVAVYMPIFRPGVPLDTVDDRRRALWGYVASLVRIDHMIEGVMAELQREMVADIDGRMTFAISDMTDPTASLPVYDGRLDRTNQPSDGLVKTMTVNVSGRLWMIEAVSTLSMQARRAQDMPGIWTRAVALFGVLLTGLTYTLGLILENRSNLRRAYAQLAEREAELDRLAHSDSLTGVANRRHFFMVGGGEWTRAKRYGRALSVLMIDVDHFKSVNDTHGHGIGDEALKKLTMAFRTVLRDCDLLARMGGEEFAVLLAEIDLAASGVVAERLRQMAAEVRVPTGDGGHLSVTVSIGAASLCSDDSSLDDVVRRADRALYAAKSGGRNQVIVSEPEEFPLLALVALSGSES
jgi:diguanylate cyclase (GGDEF)-like protein